MSSCEKGDRWEATLGLLSSIHNNDDDDDDDHDDYDDDDDDETSFTRSIMWLA